MIYSSKETADRSELQEIQDERPRETVAHAYETVPFHRKNLDDAGVNPADVTTTDDITKLPMMTKEGFRNEYPDGLFAADAEIRRIHASSGTTGKLKLVGYTEADLDVWAEVMARSLAAAGAEPGDTVQNAYGYGLFTGGMGFQQGAEEFGTMIVPTGSGGTQRQVELADDLNSDVLACTPSYALYFAETAEKMGYEPREFPVSTLIYGAENCSEPMREEIEERLGVTAIDIYGLAEMVGPGVAVECHEAQNGLHLWEDQFYPEMIDPETGEQLEPGEEGELVLTPLTKEALPVLRYRTGDLTSLTYGECKCGRTTVRMDSVTGRTDDLLIIRGINLYPTEIEHVILDTGGVAPHYRIDVYREDNLDTLELTVERAPEAEQTDQELQDEILGRLSNILSFTPDELELVAPHTLERTEVGKAQYVYDYRA
jgi:phenylacetate-CoA ligase